MSFPPLSPCGAQGEISSSYKIRNPDVLKLYSGVGHHIGSGSTVILVEYLATQTGGATVNNSFEVRFTYTKID